MAEGLKAEMDPRVLDNRLYPQMVIESPDRRRPGEKACRMGPEPLTEGTGVGDQETMTPEGRGLRGLESWPSAGLLLGRPFSLQGYLNKLPGALNSNTVGPGGVSLLSFDVGWVLRLLRVPLLSPR